MDDNGVIWDSIVWKWTVHAAHYVVMTTKPSAILCVISLDKFILYSLDVFMTICALSTRCSPVHTAHRFTASWVHNKLRLVSLFFCLRRIVSLNIARVVVTTSRDGHLLYIISTKPLIKQSSTPMTFSWTGGTVGTNHSACTSCHQIVRKHLVAVDRHFHSLRIGSPIFLELVRPPDQQWGILD